jgi:putative phage-type endonuclease
MKIISGPAAVQGSQEWLEWRLQGIGSSDAPVIMGVSPLSTPYALYLQKRGLMSPPPDNPAMARGRKLEPIARACYEKETGNIMVPLIAECTTHPFMRASYDGVAPTFDLALEVKCPGEKAHQMALAGIVPPFYMDQIQQQIHIAGIDLAHYYSFDGQHGKLLEVRRDQAKIDRLLETAALFWEKVCNGRWETDEWATAAAFWLKANQALESAKAQEEAARANLVACLDPGEPRKDGAGVSVVRVTRKGAVDYDALLAAKGQQMTEAEIESFRKKGSEVIRVTATQQEDISPALFQLAKPPIHMPAASPTVFDANFVLTM